MRPTLPGAVALVAWLLATPVDAGPTQVPPHAVPTAVLAHADHPPGSEPRELEPRYEPVPPEPEPAYNTAYFFAISRAVAGSTLVPAAKLPFLVLTVPVDIALLPFAAMGGFF